MKYRPLSRPIVVAHRAAIAVVAMATCSTILAAEVARRDPRPNFVLICIDNVGYGDLGCYGNQVIRTPSMDRLAEEGVRCTDFYISTSSCSPSRGALLTGRYPLRNGLTWQLKPDENLSGVGLPQSELLLPHYLKQRGYVTACFGKWNIGFAEGSRPTERGFDEFFGHASGNMDYYTHVYNGRNDLFRGTEPVEVEGYSTDLFADAACRFIRRNAGRPFFVYVPFNAAHVPNPKNKAPGQPCIWQAPARYFALYGDPPDEQDPYKGYRAVMTALDAGIGRIVAEVDSLGLRDNTVVFVMSDNGASVLERLVLEVGTNFPLRDGRTTVYEGGVRVPCIVRWPRRFKSGTVCREPLSHLDLFPMILIAAGCELPTDRVIDGRDPTATLAGEAPSPHEYLYFHFRKFSGLRKGRYKLVRSAPDRAFELYDLAEDIGETTDLAAEKPALVARLQAAFERWYRQFGE